MAASPRAAAREGLSLGVTDQRFTNLGPGSADAVGNGIPFRARAGSESGPFRNVTRRALMGSFTHTSTATCGQCGRLGATQVTWSLDMQTASPALPRGSYSVSVTSTDVAGNVGAAAKGVVVRL
jgi:hypothetical protein